MMIQKRDLKLFNKKWVKIILTEEDLVYKGYLFIQENDVLLKNYAQKRIINIPFKNIKAIKIISEFKQIECQTCKMPIIYNTNTFKKCPYCSSKLFIYN